MADTTFISKVTTIATGWLQDLNNFYYRFTGGTAKTTPVDGDGLWLWDSVASAWKTLSWANLRQTLVSAPGFSIVASATTPDIFNATNSQTISYTGTVACTGFVAAPNAGATRRLICNGACSFQSGANMLIEGVPSGVIVTLAANATVDVTAITTTQFKLTYSVSGTFTASAYGFTTDPVTATARYKNMNGLVHLYLPTGTFAGTSNSTQFYITGIPTAAIPPNGGNRNIGVLSFVDNGTVTYGIGLLQPTLSRIDFYRIGYAGAWTNSGSKHIDSTELIYCY